MLPNNQYLIISQSGRALAASAKRAGIDAHVVDLFGDEDTVENSVSNRIVTAFNAGENSKVFIDIVDEYFKKYPDLNIVIGSGFEDKLDTLVDLEHRFPVLGNHSSLVERIKNPVIFFEKLDELSLPHPEYFTDNVNVIKKPLLIKTIGGSGGVHIRRYQEGMKLTSRCYLQTLLKGKSYSAAFLANGKTFYLLGFNETWFSDINSNFIFSAAISNVSLEKKSALDINDAISKLVSSFELKGLCSMDFIVEDTGEYSILEVNPRPTATFELYETRSSLFAQHIVAFQGKMTKPDIEQKMTRALGLLYAEKSITIPRLEWPVWVTDRPNIGKQISEGEPVCTVHAEGLSVASTKRLLKSRLESKRELLALTVEADR